MHFAVSRKLALLWTLVCATHTEVISLPADFMSGKLGIGYRLPGGNFMDIYSSSPNWSTLVSQIKDVDADYVIVNLSAGAFGDLYIAPHSILDEMQAEMGTLTSRNKGCATLPYTAMVPASTDYFMDMATEFQAQGIKVIAYMASDGPSMFKNAKKSYWNYGGKCDNPSCGETYLECAADLNNCCSKPLATWITKVAALYNLASTGNSVDTTNLKETLKTAFAELIVAEYADRYKDVIDGYWFDHCKDGCDGAKIKTAIRNSDPNAAIALNSCSTKSPLMICSGDLEDYTSGHPNPVNRNVPWGDNNEPMVTSIESTANGYFELNGNEQSLGHIFMPTPANSWNGVGRSVGWTDASFSSTLDVNQRVERAKDWFCRTITAGGAWTWNVVRAGNSDADYYLLDQNHLDFAKDVTNQCPAMQDSPDTNGGGDGGASGDPHFKTWAGEKYDFHGVCDLVLLYNTAFHNGLGMDIHIRTKKTRQFSYISTAVLRIGNETLEVAGRKDGNTHWINRIQGTETDALFIFAGFPVTYRQVHSNQKEYAILFDNEEEIVFKTWIDFVRIDVKGAGPKNFAGSLGLMGSFPKGAKKSRDNMTVMENVDNFGQEWQVRADEPKLFHTVDGPQAPARCEIASKNAFRRRLAESNISMREAELACSRVSQEEQDLCVFDVMATNDKDVASAYLLNF